MFSRTEIILGSESIACLSESRVAVFGIGGVGGYVCEALIRTGLGHIDLIDHDTVSESNLNRQIIATTDTIGRNKVEIMRDRLLSINPEADVRIFPCFFLPENASDFHFEEYDYIVDAVDTVTAKLELITRADETGTPIISAMGASIYARFYKDKQQAGTVSLSCRRHLSDTCLSPGTCHAAGTEKTRHHTSQGRLFRRGSRITLSRYIRNQGQNTGSRLPRLCRRHSRLPHGLRSSQGYHYGHLQTALAFTTMM